MSKLTDGFLDDDRLIRHLVHSDPDWQLANDLVHLLLQGLAEMQNVGAGFHVDREADGRLSIDPIEHLRRVGVSTPNGDEIAETEKAVIYAKIDRPKAFLGKKLAADAKNDSLRSGFHHT